MLAKSSTLLALAAHIPLKQGLRHHTSIYIRRFLLARGAYSTKTRIKTLIGCFVLLMSYSSRGAYSTKTRIKTFSKIADAFNF